MQNEIRVLRVFCYILLYGGANNIDLEIMISGPTESSSARDDAKAHLTQFFRNFRMVQRQNISGQTVIEIGHFTVALNFEPA